MSTPQVAGGGSSPSNKAWYDYVFNKKVVNTIKGAVTKLSGEFGTLYFAGSNIVKGMEGAGIFSHGNPFMQTAVSIASMVHFTLQLVPSAQSLTQIVSLKNDMFDRVKAPNPKQLRQSRIADVTEACNYVGENHKNIRKTLGIAKETRIDERAKAILQGIASPNSEEQQLQAIEKGEEFVRILRQRVKTKLGIDTAKLAVRAAGVAVSALLAFSTPNPVSLSLAGAVGLSVLGLWASEKIMLPADPFAEPSDAWHQKAAHNIRQGVYKVADSVEGFFTQTAEKAKDKISSFAERFMPHMPVY